MKIIIVIYQSQWEQLIQRDFNNCLTDSNRVPSISKLKDIFMAHFVLIQL